MREVTIIMYSDTLTWIGPYRLDIGVVVIGQLIGTRCVEVQSEQSLLQSSIDTLHHGDDFRLCREITYCQCVHSTLSDVGGGCLHIFIGHCRGHREKSRSQLVAFLRRNCLD